jgi:hypothetical protein
VAAAFLAAGAFFSATFFSVFFSAVFFSVTFFSALGSDFLVAVAVTGLASFFASFTGPDVPVLRVRKVHIDSLDAHGRCAAATRRGRCCAGSRQQGRHLPLGRAKSPFSSPDVIARLTWPLKAASLRLPTLLLAWIYFWIA